MTCCSCGLMAHGLQVWGNRDCASFHLRYSGPCSRCLCGHGLAYGCSPGTVVDARDVDGRIHSGYLPPSWIRAIFRWTVDADGAWTTEGGSIYNQFGGLHLSPMDTANRLLNPRKDRPERIMKYVSRLIFVRGRIRVREVHESALWYFVPFPSQAVSITLDPFAPRDVDVEHCIRVEVAESFATYAQVPIGGALQTFPVGYTYSVVAYSDEQSRDIAGVVMGHMAQAQTGGRLYGPFPR